MSLTKRLGTLPRELVEAISSALTQDRSRLDRLCDDASRRLESHSFLQTNHFEVDETFEGLDERFRVNNRDDLADALRARLESLNRSPAVWHPEILHLLLELSDQPTFKFEFEDFRLLKNEEHEPSTVLRWEEIAKEDGWDQDDLLWKPRDYSDVSSDGSYETDSAPVSEVTSILDGKEQLGRAAASYIVQPEDVVAFERVRASQMWRMQPQAEGSSKHLKKIAISNMQVIRDVLFMLQGLECTLFDHDCVAVPFYQQADMEWESFRAILRSFSNFGGHIQKLRCFAAQRKDVPHLQAFQDCAAERLRKLDTLISELQRKLAAPPFDQVLSLLRIKAELAPRLEPLCALTDILRRIESEGHPTPFRYLELLFDETCVAQLSGKPDLYEFLARIFAECFSVYLRPIRLWMDEGKLLTASDLFFVAETSSPVPLGKTWQGRFYLRKSAEGTLHSPNFLRTATGSIYNAGKNVVVLRMLGKHDAAMSRRKLAEPALDYETICPSGRELVPFSELFDVAFDRWIQSKYRATSTVLKDALYDDWALSSTLDTLHSIYFMSNGSASASFCEDIFAKLDGQQTDWSDQDALTAAAQDSFASVKEAGRLKVRVESEAQRLPPKQAQNTVKAVLSSVRMSYRLPWPLQMIVTDDSMEKYQSIFTFLLQLKRAVDALQKFKNLDSNWADEGNWRATASLFYSRTKLLWFCTTIQTYFTTLILTPLNLQLGAELGSATDMDEMIAAHGQTLKAMVDQACLGQRLAPIRESILDVLDLALQLEHWRSGMEEEEEAPEGSRERRLTSINNELDRHVRFIYSGLRSIARASSDVSSSKWDMLADMLQAGGEVG